jgi:hypothetical protein
MKSTSPIYWETLIKKTVAKNTIGCMGWEQDLCVLSEAENQMFTPALDTSADLAISLLIHYSFDLSGYSASELVGYWQKQYPGNWLHLAVIEALYQGRYKAISVQQILTCWQRRGQAIFHFNMEFERLICSKFPQSLTSLPPDVGMGKVEDTSMGIEVLPEDTSRNFRGPAQPTRRLPASASTHYENRVAAQPEELALGYAVNTASSSGEGLELNSPTGKLSSPEKEASHRRQLLPRDKLPSKKVSIDQGTQGRGIGESAIAQETSLSLEGIPHSPTPLSPHPPVATNNPPIGQFTPETNAGSELFTSKLKAISNEKLLSFGERLPGHLSR